MLTLMFAGVRVQDKTSQGLIAGELPLAPLLDPDRSSGLDLIS